jgi:hypothetical protein
MSNTDAKPSLDDEKGSEDAITDHLEKVIATHNVEAAIKNPLAGIPRAQLLRNVETFAHEKGLTEHLPILTKGAIR